MKRSQGSFEYILMLAGILLVSILIVLILQSTTGSANQSVSANMDAVKCLNSIDCKVYKAVFFDGNNDENHNFGITNPGALVDVLTANGYKLMQDAELATWIEKMTQNSASAQKAVLVMAKGGMPSAVVDQDNPGQSLIRKYLDAGGTIIWVGEYPGHYMFFPVGEGYQESDTYTQDIFGYDPGVANWPADAGDCTLNVNLTKYGLGDSGTTMGQYSYRRVAASTLGNGEGISSDAADPSYACSWLKRYSKFPTSGLIVLGQTFPDYDGSNLILQDDVLALKNYFSK